MEQPNLDLKPQDWREVKRRQQIRIDDSIGVYSQYTPRQQEISLDVTHHPEDDIPCITSSMDLVPAGGGGYTSSLRCSHRTDPDPLYPRTT